MKTKETTMVSFYQLLGRIFYATAQADKVVRSEEVIELKQIVKNVWLDVEDAEDEFNTDAAFQIEFVFDYLLANDVIVENTIQELKEFKAIHTSLFSDQMVNLIMATADRIASSFSKRNKSELVFLSQLRIALEN